MVCYWEACEQEADYVVIHPQIGVDESLNHGRLFCRKHANDVLLDTKRNMHLEEGDLIAILKIEIVDRYKKRTLNPQREG